MPTKKQANKQTVGDKAWMGQVVFPSHPFWSLLEPPSPSTSSLKAPFKGLPIKDASFGSLSGKGL